MYRQGDMMNAIAARGNLLLAFWKAQRGKRLRREVLAFRENLEAEVARLHRALLYGPLELGPYRMFRVFEPKERVICAVPFRDRVLHHALMNECAPIFEAYQIWDSYACRVGKGTHRAVERAQTFAQRGKHFLKFDIRKYFDSIDHGILLSQLFRRFKDARLLDVFAAIIGGYAHTPGKGIPIGNLTSQCFANHYLARFDHFVKETLRCRHYVRYMDDFVLWDDDRKQLCAWREEAGAFLRETLLLTPKTPSLNCSLLGMTFLGYRIFPRRITLAHRSRVRFKRKLAFAHGRLASGLWSEEETARHVEPLLSFVRHANTTAMRNRVLASL